MVRGYLLLCLALLQTWNESLAKGQIFCVGVHRHAYLRIHIIGVLLAKLSKIFCYHKNYPSSKFFATSAHALGSSTAVYFPGNDHMVVMYHHEFNVQV